MDTPTSSRVPRQTAHFQPLPAGATVPRPTPARVREQLGWHLLPANTAR